MVLSPFARIPGRKRTVPERQCRVAHPLEDIRAPLAQSGGDGASGGTGGKLDLPFCGCFGVHEPTPFMLSSALPAIFGIHNLEEQKLKRSCIAFKMSVVKDCAGVAG